MQEIGTPDRSAFDGIDFGRAEHHQVVIVGTGPAGLTAALYAARANLSPVVYQGPEPGGQLVTTTDVENYPGFPDGVMGPDMMEKFEAQAARFGADLRYGTVTAVDFSERPFRLLVDEVTPLLADAVIVSTGASARYLGLENERRLLGRGVSACATCDGAFFRDVDIAVVCSGYAGPTAGPNDEWVGLVHFAVASAHGVRHLQRVFPFERNRVKRVAAYVALWMVYRSLREDWPASEDLLEGRWTGSRNRRSGESEEHR